MILALALALGPVVTAPAGAVRGATTDGIDAFKAIHPDHSLQLALYTVVPSYLLAVVLFLFLGRAFGREEAAAKEVFA